MPTLADHIRILPRFARSANLERDSGRSEPLEGYVVTARALDAVERILTVAATQPAGGSMVSYRPLRVWKVVARPLPRRATWA